MTMSRNNLTTDEIISKYCGKVSYKIGSEWLRWGRHLGLSDSDLDNIGSDYMTCYEKADMVLKKWKQKNGNSSWERIKNELLVFERCDIVVEIENEFGGCLTTTKFWMVSWYWLYALLWVVILVLVICLTWVICYLKSDFPEILAEIQKFKHVIPVRVYVVDLCQSISTEYNKLIILATLTNENGINSYVENNVIEEKKKL